MKNKQVKTTVDFTKTSFLYSLAIHGALLLLLAGGVPGCGGLGGKKGGGSPEEKSEKAKEQGLKDTNDKKNPIHDIEQRTTYIEIEEPKKPEEGIGKPVPPKPKFTERDCGKLEWFGGIGVEVGLGTSDQPIGIYFTKVHKNYPADKMGIKDGDRLVNAKDYSTIRGEPGTTITVTVSRNGEEMTFTGKRERICLEPIPGAQP